MSIKPDVFMPVFVGDVLKHIARLDRADIGSYFLLLLDYWVMGAPPDDDDVLARIARCPPQEWPETRARLSPYFRVVAGHWRQKRVEEELQKAARRSSKASGAAFSRWADGEGEQQETAAAPAVKPRAEPISADQVREQTTEAKEAGGEALASMATHPGMSTIAPLRALLAGDNPCDWVEDVLPAIRSAAAWHMSRNGSGSMVSWTTATKMAVENRDRRLAGPKENGKSNGSATSQARDDNIARAFRSSGERPQLHR